MEYSSKQEKTIADSTQFVVMGGGGGKIVNLLFIKKSKIFFV